MAILAQLQRLFMPSAEKKAAHMLHVQAVQQARALEFYLEMGVPDTLDGRFELITLHVALLIHRLQKLGDDDPKAANIARLLSETYFADMDRSLREMGVSDTGMSRRMKTIASAFYGRLQVYQECIDDDDALEEALRRNLYGTLEEPPATAQLRAMGYYVRQTAEAINHAPAEILLEGNAPFLPLQGMAA